VVRHTRAATQRSITVLIAIAGLVSACTAGSSPATTASPASNSSTAPVGSGALTSAPASSAAATAGSSTGSTGGTCKYLADSDVAALFPNAGAVKLTGADTPAGTVTSCHWGTGSLATKANVVQLVVDDLKLDVALVAAKKSLTANVTEPIAGLGDFGGFSTQEADIISIEFYKGTKTALLAVAVPGMTPAAVSTLALKIAAGL
jgi:hypothetical protein